MPTYVYKFVETGETIEIQQSFSDPTLTEYAHPESGVTMPVKKVFLPVGVTFKGDGFYKTDSRRNGGSAKSSKTESSGGSTETSSSSSDSSGSSSSSTSGSSSTSSASGTSGTPGD